MTNGIVIRGNCAAVVIPYRGQRFEALVDFLDLPKVEAFRGWHVSVQFGVLYVRGNDGTADASMHRVITGCPDELLVDHRNWDGLDNRRSNLRMCDSSFNNSHKRSFSQRYRQQLAIILRTPARVKAKSSSGFQYVYRRGGAGRYFTQVHLGGKTVRLGVFDDPREAAIAVAKLLGKHDSQLALEYCNKHCIEIPKSGRRRKMRPLHTELDLVRKIA